MVIHQCSNCDRVLGIIRLCIEALEGGDTLADQCSASVPRSYEATEASYQHKICSARHSMRIRSQNLHILAFTLCGRVLKKGECIYIALRHGSHNVTCNYTNVCLYLVSVHQMAPPQTEVADF